MRRLQHHPARPAARVPAPHTASLLPLLWLASPDLPVGGFSYSEGLEAAVEAGKVHDEASATAWVLDQLHLSLARADLPVLDAQLSPEGESTAVRSLLAQGMVFVGNATLRGPFSVAGRVR